MPASQYFSRAGRNIAPQPPLLPPTGSAFGNVRSTQLHLTSYPCSSFRTLYPVLDSFRRNHHHHFHFSTCTHTRISSSVATRIPPASTTCTRTRTHCGARPARCGSGGSILIELPRIDTPDPPLVHDSRNGKQDASIREEPAVGGGQCTCL